MGTSNCQGNLTKCWGVTCDGLASHPGGVVILLVASCYRNRDKLQQLCEPGSWLKHCTVMAKPIKALELHYVKLNSCNYFTTNVMFLPSSLSVNLPIC